MFSKFSFHDAVRSGDLNKVKSFYGRPFLSDPNIEARDKECRTPLKIASMSPTYNEELLNFLLSKGASIYQQVVIELITNSHYSYYQDKAYGKFWSVIYKNREEPKKR